MKSNFIYPVVIAALLSGVSPVCAAEMARLDAPALNGALQPEAPVQFTLSSSIGKDQLNNLFVEFDGYDITSMVQMNGLAVSYQPPQKLSPGNYLLRLVERMPNGKFVELERWEIRIAGPGIPSRPEVSGTFDGQVRQTLSDNLEGRADESRTSARSNLQVQAKTGGEQWNTSARANVYYDTIGKHNPDHENLELGEYLLTQRAYANDLSLLLRFGNHDPGLSNMLVNNFYRRGLSANLGLGNTLNITGFAADPARATGWVNAAGVTDDKQLVGGIFAKYYPYYSYFNDRVFVESGVYHGDGTLKGSSVAVADNFQNAGDGVTIGAQAQTLDDKMRVRGDYAHTKFDDDGESTLVSSKAGNGYRAMLTITPYGDLKAPDADFRQWTITTLYQKTGTFFRSLANTTLPQDEERLDVGTTYQHKTLVVTGEAYATRNNTDGSQALPTDGTAGFLGQASVSPAYFDETLAPDHWFTYSTFTFGGSFLDAERLKTPSAFSGLDLNQAVWTVNAGWTAPFKTWTLSLNDVYSGFEDSVTGTNSYNDNLATLSVSWNATDWLRLTPSVQQEIKDQRNVGTQSKYFVTFDSAATLIPAKLLHTFHYSALLDDGGTGSDQHNASTAITWQVRPAEKNSPGVALSLNGDYQNIRPSAIAVPGTVTGENYRVYLQLTVSAPFAY